MSAANLELWNVLSKTDPTYTKNFQRTGGFKGTAQNPTYAIKKMTERFGSCGKGWGIGKPEFTMHDAGDAGVLVYATVMLWYMDDGVRCETYGVGGDTVVSKTKHGLSADDEAFKKATTDALTNAMKTLGMAADIHMGMYDDSKYVNALKAESSGKGNADAKPEHTPEEIIANLEKALTVSVLSDTRALHEKDIALYKQQDKAAFDRIVAAGTARKAFLDAEFKKQADAIVTQSNERTAADELDKRLNDTIVY